VTALSRGVTVGRMCAGGRILLFISGSGGMRLKITRGRETAEGRRKRAQSQKKNAKRYRRNARHACASAALRALVR